MLIHNKDDIDSATEFPCSLGHPVYEYICMYYNNVKEICYSGNLNLTNPLAPSPFYMLIGNF